MTARISPHEPKKSNNPVAQALQDVLTGTYTVYLATHNYHWNVEGAKFVSLHKLFEDQYNELFIAIDAIAEHIRTLDAYAQPLEGGSILEVSKTIANVLNKESNADERADRMLENLISENENAVKLCQTAKKAAQSSHDDESENLLVERITAHQKAIWMLRSVLK